MPDEPEDSGQQPQDEGEESHDEREWDVFSAGGVFSAGDEDGAGEPPADPEPGPSTGSSTGPSTGEEPATPALSRGGRRRRIAEWRGGHRSEGGRREVSTGVIAALYAVVAVVGAVILWRFFGDALSNRSQQAAARCVGGSESVAVIVDPSIADPVQELAKSYNATAGPIGDHCVSVNVKPAGSDAVVGGLVGKWPADLGAQPALWIPGSSVSAARLSAATGQQSISDSRSLVTSPVLLAVRPQLRPALASQSWATLPGLQTNPNAMAGLNLPTWGSLRLAVPMSGNGDAAYLAGEAVAAASVPAGAPATQGIAAVRTLVNAQPKLADNSLAEALNTLLTPGDAAAAPVHAVITTEQQLFQRGQSLADVKNTVDSWLPPGPVPVADYPTVLLSGAWLSHDQTAAASEFTHYMRKPEHLAKFAEAGFRVNGAKSPSSAVTSFPALPSTLSVGDDTTRATLAGVMATPSSGLVATIMLDQSMPAVEGGKTRLDNVVAALNDRINALPPTSVLGLWSFDGREGRTEIAAGPLSDPVGGRPRSAALAAALGKQQAATGGAVSFTTLRLVYQEMQSKFVAGQPNSILVITTGPHTDQSLDGPGLQNFIRTGADPLKPIAVNVIDFGGDSDRETWEAVAKLSGGNYQNLATSASPDLASAIGQFLG